jgi:hypothetical protein
MSKDVSSITSMNILVGLLLLGLISCHKSGVTVEKVEEAIKTEVPVGSSKEHALEFLDSYTFGQYRFKRSEFIDLIDNPENLSMLLEYDNSDDKPNRLKDRLGGLVGAAILDVERDPLTHTDIVLRLYFDKSGRFIDYTVKSQVSE